jgi:hypothetical protein
VSKEKNLLRKDLQIFHDILISQPGTLKKKVLSFRTILEAHSYLFFLVPMPSQDSSLIICFQVTTENQKHNCAKNKGLAIHHHLRVILLQDG